MGHERPTNKKVEGTPVGELGAVEKNAASDAAERAGAERPQPESSRAQLTADLLAASTAAVTDETATGIGSQEAWQALYGDGSNEGGDTTAEAAYWGSKDLGSW